MDPLLLSRIQFGVTIGFHYLFPITTLGLTAFILFFETLHLFTGNPRHREAGAFLVRIVAPVFVVGVASGLLMPFAFGTNWGQFSRITGEVFGPLLAIESVVAFFLESVFLGVLLFGGRRIGRRLYWLSTFLVFLGSHLSGFFIVAANSWMQTPAGFRLEKGRLVLQNLGQVIFNPSTPVRFLHTITAAWVAGALILCAIGAWYLLRKREEELARTLLRIAIPAFAVLPLVELALGHEHIMGVVHHQPEKAAAFEGIFQSTGNAPLYLFGVPDAENRRIRLGVKIPGLLSFLEGFSTSYRVQGLEEVPGHLMPPVNVVFTTFHLMETIGFLLIGAGLLGAFLLWRGKLFQTRWYLRMLPFLVPLPYVASESGWMSTEIGRQPWIVYGILKTHDAASLQVSWGEVWISLVVLAAIYILLGVALVSALARVLAAAGRPPR